MSSPLANSNNYDFYGVTVSFRGTFGTLNGTGARNDRRACSSMHEGGLHFLLGDGSVRFISENLNAQTFYDLGSRNDGRTLGEF